MNSPKLIKKHQKELYASGIAPEIATTNFYSSQGEEAIELIFHDISKVSGKVHPDAQWRWLKGYYKRSEDGTRIFIDRSSHLLSGGWIFQGVDPLNNGESMEWGCFKPDQPRSDSGKPIKYEHPRKVNTRAFFPAIPWNIGYKIASRYGLKEEYLERIHSEYVRHNDYIIIDSISELPEDWLKNHIDRGFYDWVRSKIQIAIIITEGAKKAAALVSAGYVAIGLPGIWNGRRVNRITQEATLIPEIKYFCQEKRTFTFCFDQDNKPNTVKNVRCAIFKTGKLLSDSGCNVRVISWKEPYKGVDDLIAAVGEERFLQIYKSAVNIAQWQWALRNQTKLKTPVSVEVNTQDLSTIGLKVPDSGIIGILSGKGTGKTKLLVQLLQDSEELIGLTHRISLGRANAERLGATYIKDADRATQSAKTSIFDSRKHNFCSTYLDENGEPTKRIYLCGESLLSINPRDFTNQGFDLVIDEAVQFLRSLLTSSTCNQDGKRPVLLARFTELCSRARRIILADADLDDATINYIKTLRGEGSCYLIKNNYKPKSYKAVIVDCPDYSWVVVHAVAMANAGKKIFVATDSRNGSEVLAEMIKQGLKVPEHRILVINQSTSGDEKAQAFIKNPSTESKNYDVIIASPSMSTGVSIEINGYFDEVIGIFYGVLNDGDIAQALGRVREPVERIVWVNKHGINCDKVSRSSFPNIVKRDLFNQYDREAGSIRCSLRPDTTAFLDYPTDRRNCPHINTYCQIAADHNASMWNLRENLIARLKHEGCEVDYLVTKTDADTKKAIKEVKEQVLETRYENISAAHWLGSEEQQQYRNSEALTLEQQYALTKADVANFCHFKEEDDELITPKICRLVLEDRNKLTRLEDLFYGLAIDKDEAAILRQGSWGLELFAPDFPMREQQRLLAEKLGIPALLNRYIAGEVFNDVTVYDLCELIRHYHKDVNEVLKIGFSPTSRQWSNIRIWNAILKRYGIKPVRERKGRGEDRETLSYIDSETWETIKFILDLRTNYREQQKAEREANPQPEQEAREMPIRPIFSPKAESTKLNNSNECTNGNELNKDNEHWYTSSQSNDLSSQDECTNANGLKQNNSHWYTSSQPTTNGMETNDQSFVPKEKEEPVTPKPIERGMVAPVEEAIAKVKAEVADLTPESLIGRAVTYWSSYQKKLISLGRIKAIDSVEEVVDRALNIKRKVVSFVTTTGDYITDRELEKGVYKLA